MSRVFLLILKYWHVADMYLGANRLAVSAIWVISWHPYCTIVQYTK